MGTDFAKNHILRRKAIRDNTGVKELEKYRIRWKKGGDKP